MRKLITAALAAAAGLAALPMSGAQAQPLQLTPAVDDGAGGRLIFGVDSAADRPMLDRVQYFWGGHRYCWYDGWRGPGWYWCGYGWRRGFGWGGGYGWRGWHGGGHWHGDGHWRDRDGGHWHDGGRWHDGDGGHWRGGGDGHWGGHGDGGHWGGHGDGGGHHHHGH